MGFMVDHTNVEEREYGAGEVLDVRAHLHEKLDQLIERTAEFGGAEALVEITAPSGNQYTLRLTLCDFTDEQPCATCDGTGVKAHETAH